jgi:hypothetical protein
LKTNQDQGPDYFVRLAFMNQMLLDGQKGLADRKSRIPPRLQHYIRGAGEGIVNLYEAQGLKAKAQYWRQELDHSAPSR